MTKTYEMPAADARFTTAKGAGLYLGNAGYAAPFTILAKDAWGNDLRATSAPQPKFKALAFTPDQGEAVYADVVYSGDDGAFDVAYTAYVQGPHTVAVVMQAAPEVQTITTNFTSRASVAGAGVVGSIFARLLRSSEAKKDATSGMRR